MTIELAVIIILGLLLVLTHGQKKYKDGYLQGLEDQKDQFYEDDDDAISGWANEAKEYRALLISLLKKAHLENKDV